MDDLDEDDDDDDDDDDEDSDEDMVPSSSKNARVAPQPVHHASKSQGQARVAVGTVTQLVPEGGEFKTGDFVMLTTDADKDSAPIWRLDSKTLLQRYNPLSGGGGDSLHKSANLFTGFVQSNRERYASVAVKFVSADSNSYTVKVIKSASD